MAGKEGAVGAGSGFGGAKDADVVIKVAVERMGVDEVIELDGTKEIADAVADTGLRNFLAKRKGRSEGSPIRAAENSTQNVHHNREAVALVPTAVAVGTQRQERAPVDHLIRIRGSAAFVVDGPAFRNRLAAPARYFDFSVGCGAGGHINHNGRLLVAGETDGNGIGTEHALGAPQS